jgi:hypothetical protein
MCKVMNNVTNPYEYIIRFFSLEFGSLRLIAAVDFLSFAFRSSLVQFNVCIRPSPKFPPHLIIALVNILGTSYECERNTVHIYIYI